MHGSLQAVCAPHQPTCRRCVPAARKTGTHRRGGLSRCPLQSPAMPSSCPGTAPRTPRLGGSAARPADKVGWAAIASCIGGRAWREECSGDCRNDSSGPKRVCSSASVRAPHYSTASLKRLVLANPLPCPCLGLAGCAAGVHDGADVLSLGRGWCRGTGRETAAA